MIEIVIKTDGEKIMDTCNDKYCTLQEIGVVVYRLEQIKLKLLNKQFESDFEVIEDDT